jgi:hypothetical protein
MQGGRKLIPPSEKRARGTFQRCRDAGKLGMMEPASVPPEPDGLTAAGRQAWLEMLEHVAGQVSARDNILLGQLANLIGVCNQAWRSGATPPIAALTELRQLCELFGLAGSRSRLLTVARSAENPFANNGVRGRASADTAP